MQARVHTKTEFLCTAANPHSFLLERDLRRGGGSSLGGGGGSSLSSSLGVGGFALELAHDGLQAGALRRLLGRNDGRRGGLVLLRVKRSKHRVDAETNDLIRNDGGQTKSTSGHNERVHGRAKGAHSSEKQGLAWFRGEPPTRVGAKHLVKP